MRASQASTPHQETRATQAGLYSALGRDHGEKGRGLVSGLRAQEGRVFNPTPPAKAAGHLITKPRTCSDS